MNGDAFLINNRFYIQPAFNHLRDLKTGKDCRMEPRMMAVLYFLSQRPGELVTREQLVTEIWNDYGGGNEGLSQAVSFLRKVLHDRERQLIRTIPKKGYQLSAAITASVESERKRVIVISGQRLKMISRIALSLYVVITAFYFTGPVFFKTKMDPVKQVPSAAHLEKARPLTHAMARAARVISEQSPRKPSQRIAANLKDVKSLVHRAAADMVYTDAPLSRKTANDYHRDTQAISKPVAKSLPTAEPHVVPRFVLNPVAVMDTVVTPTRIHKHIRVHVHIYDRV